MELKKGQLKKVMNQLEEYSIGRNNLEEWINDFMEGFTNKFESISTMIWVINWALGVALDSKELRKDESEAELALIKYFKETLKDEDRKEEVIRLRHKLNELEEFFEQFDI